MKKPTEMTDEELVLQFTKKQSSAAFEELYDRYIDKVYGRCLSFTQSEEESKDFAHDIFIKVIHSMGDLKEPKYFSSWLFRVSYNFLINRYKEKKKWELEGLNDDLWMESDEDLEESSFTDAARLKIGLSKLSTEERTPLLMYYQDEMSIKEIASIVEAGESAIKMRLKRSRDRLKSICESL